MPNFDVEIRRDQHDVSGLVLACPIENVVLDGSDVTGWENSASAVGPASTDPRFEDLVQATPANRPTLVAAGGHNYVRFDLTNSEFLNLPRNAGTWTGIDEWLIAIVGKKTADVTNDQRLLSLPNIQVLRRNSAGNKAYIHGVTEQAGSGDWVDGASIVRYNALATGDWYENGALDYSGTCAAVNPNADGAIGKNYVAASGYLDFDMNAVYVWRRSASPHEVDFLFAHIDPTTDHSANDWATVRLMPWTDDTASPPRINPYTGAEHKYYLVTVPTGTSRMIQIASRVSGITTPDTGLGGDLFTHSWVEYPASSIPAVFKFGGWSSVFNVRVSNEGHYCMSITRPDGGSVLVHFDVEVV